MINKLMANRAFILLLFSISLLASLRCQMTVFPENILEYDAIFRDDLKVEEKFRYILFASAADPNYVDEYNGLFYQALDCRNNEDVPFAALNNIEETNLKRLYRKGCFLNNKYNYIRSGYTTDNATAVFEITFRLSNPSDQELEMKLVSCTRVESTNCIDEVEVDNNIVIPPNNIFKYIFRWNKNKIWTSTDNFATSKNRALPNLFTFYFYTTNLELTDAPNVKRLYIHSMILTVDLGTEVRALTGNTYNFCVNNGCAGGTECFRNTDNNYCSNPPETRWTYPYQDCGNKGCIPGTYCSLNCLPCDEQCATCHNETPMNCKSCYPTALAQYWYNTVKINPGRDCPFEYISLTNFGSIKANVPIPTTYRMTIEFWVFIHNTKDLTDSTLRSSVSSIILKDFFTISLMPSGTGRADIDIMLLPYEYFYPFPEDIISVPQLNAFITSNADIQRVTDSITNPSSHWVHIKAGLSYQQKEMFSNTQTKALNPIVFLTGGNHYSSYIRKFYKEGDSTSILFQGFSYVNSFIYVRNVNVYSEYIPPSISPKYFNLQAITTYDIFPQLLFSLPFDETHVDSSTLTASSKLYDYSGQFTIGTNNVYKTDESFKWIRGSLKPPKNFRRLKLLVGGANKQYSSTDLRETTNLPCTPPIAFCFDEEKPFVCSDNNSLILDTLTCGINCNNSMRLPNNKINQQTSTKLNRNFCGYQCDSNVLFCPDQNQPINTFSCKPNFTSIFFQCIDNTLLPPSKSALQFSSTLNTHSIELDLPSSYNNFLIEMWFHPELLYQRDPPFTKKHILKTNAHELYFSPMENSLMFKANINGLESDFVVTQKLYYYGWNHIIFSNKPVQSNTYTEFSLSILNSFQLIGSAAGLASMNKICFCNKDLCCGSTDIEWLDIWLREVKVWDGSLVNSGTLIDYDKFSYVRIGGLLHFFPFQISNLNVNIITDSINPAIIAKFPNQKTKLNPDQDMNFNYGWDFAWNDINHPDFITKIEIVNKNKVTVTKKEQCNVGCEICFGVSKNSCFKCKPGYALSGATCTLTSDNIGYYYYMNPLNAPGQKLSLAVPNLSSYQSITFFCYLKVYGFSNNALVSGDTNMITFDSASNFILKYNPSSFEMALSLNGITQFTYQNFINDFGQWIPISISAFRSTDLTLQLHMNSMTVGSKPLKILINPPQMFPFNEMTFSEGMIGLISQITLFNQFIINALGYAQHYNSPTSLFNDPAIVIKHFPMRDTNSNLCVPLVDIVSPPIVSGLKCVEDYVAHIDQKCTDKQYVSLLGQYFPPKCVDNASKCDNIVQTIIAMTNCDYLYATCDNISRNSIYNMPFSYSNTLRENYITCGKSNTLDMGRFNPGTIPNIKSPNDVFKLEFWFLSQSYVGINFGSFTVSWHRHMKITVSFTGGKFHAHCYPLIDNADSSLDGIGIGFDYAETTVTENKWRYAVCGVDIAGDEYYITNLQKENNVKSVLGLSGAIIPSGTVNLLISETSRTNFGVTYIKELRLWNCYQCSSDRAFIPFDKDDVLFNKMIHYFKFEDTTGLIKDYRSNTINGDLAVSVQLTQKMSFNGYGLLKKIPAAPNCNESGFNYFSLKKGVGCDVLFNMNMLPDITFPKIPSSKSGRYTMDMWFYIESADDFTQGFNIIFNEHMALSSFAQSKSEFDITVYCFPQAYRDNLHDKSGVDILNAYNSAQNKLNDIYINGYSKWNYMRCAYNYDTKQAYLNNQAPIIIIPETLYSNPTSHSNASPFKFFPNFYNKLIINKVVDNFTRIFIQTINIFREYIPQSIPLSRISMKNYANANYYPLIFSVDFQNDYDIIQNRLKYYYTDPDYVPSSPAYLTRFLANSRPKTYLTYPLYEDFVVCGVGRTFNLLSNECEIITSPGTCDNKITFCFGNNKFFYCKKGLYLDIDTFTCNPDCPPNYTRMPDIANEMGMCQFPSSLFIQLPQLNDELKQGTYQNLFKCNSATEIRVYYQCLAKSLIDSSAIYFSNKYSFTNTIADYSSLKLKDYFVDFWFMFERIEQFRFSNNAERRTIFIAYPHFITRVGETIEYNNQFIPLTFNTIRNIKKHEWNRIVIENYVIEGKTIVDTRKYVNIYVNNNYITPAVQIESTKQDDFSLSQIAFCSHVNDGFSICNLGLDSFSYKVFAPIWDDAFYRDIIVWNRKGTNLSNINSYHTLYNELTSNIISYHTMRLNTITPKNIQSSINSPSVDLIARYNTMSNYDSGASINFITDFDIGLPSSTITDITSHYVDASIPMFSLSDTTYTVIACTNPCLRCFSTNVNDCFSCVSGFVLSGTKCSTKTNYYFKTPTSNSDTQSTIDLNIDISSYEEVTITFYMKFLGSLKKDVSIIPILFFYNNQNYLGWNNDNNSFCLIYDNDKKAFDYESSRLGVGKWALFGITISKGRKNAGETSITFPNMINIMIDQVIVSPLDDFGSIIMSQSIDFNKLTLSNKVSALFYNLRVFNKYYLGSFGIGQDPTSNNLSSFKAKIEFKSIANDDSCINTPDSIGIGYCISDLNQYDDPGYNCPRPSTQFKIVNPFDLTFTCTDCDNYCTKHCFDKGIKGCTCAIDSETYWIRNETSYYCNRPDSLNIAEFSPTVISNIKIGSATSYMIEVWVFVLDYLSDKFEGLNISWDAFNRIELLPKDNNDLYSRCYPYVEINNMGRWPENAESVIQKGKWQFLRCKVDQYAKLIVMNDKEKPLSTLSKPSSVTSSQLKIEDMNQSPYSYGVILVRELRLWNENNNLFYDTARLNLATDNTYKNLIHYFKNIFPATELRRNYMYDEMTKQKHTLTTKRRFNYHSYISSYEQLVLCNEGQVYKLNSITNKYECSLYNSDDILGNLENDTTLYTPNDLLTKAKMLNEMALNKYDIPSSSLIYSKITQGMDGSLTLKDPLTSNSYCSNKGYAKIIDRFLCCYCFVDNVGSYCQLPAKDYSNIDKVFSHFTKKAFDTYETYKDSADVDKIISAIDYLITGAGYYLIINDFMIEITAKLQTVIYRINDCREDLLKIVDHLYTDVFLLINYYKVGIITNLSSGSARNAKLNYLQQDEISPTAISVKQFIEYLAEKCFDKVSSTNIHFNFKSDNFNIDLIQAKTEFNYEEFFSNNRKMAYEPYFSLSTCLKNDANIMYINWYNSPYYYNENIHWNYTSSYMTIKAFDLFSNQMTVEKCDDPITFYLNNFNPELAPIINENKNYFKKSNIYLPTDPIFTEPFFIEPNGKVNTTTRQERIENYFFEYRLSFKSFDAKTTTLTNDGLSYEDIREEDNYFICKSNHLSEFILTYDYNDPPTAVDGRLYFLKHLNLFIYGPNYSMNIGFFAILIIIFVYLINLIVCLIKFSRKKKKKGINMLFECTLTNYVFPYGNFEGEFFFKEDGKKIFKSDENLNSNNDKDKIEKLENETKVTTKEKEIVMTTQKHNSPFDNLEISKPPESNVLTINKRVLNKNQFENFFSKITSNNQEAIDGNQSNCSNGNKPSTEAVYTQSHKNTAKAKNNNNNYIDTKNAINDNDIDTVKLNEEYKHNLRIYNEDFRTRLLQQMRISCCKFFWINFSNRNMFVNSFKENIIYTPGIKSLYLPMYLSLVLFFNTLIYLFQSQMLFELLLSSQLLPFIGFSLVVIISANIYFYIKSLLFNISKSSMRELLLKSRANPSEFITDYARHTRRFNLFLVCEIILFVVFIFLSFLFAFGLSVVYADQAKCMIASTLFGIVLDFIFSIIIELLIASCYACRRNNVMVIILDHVNRFKSNKVISP